MNKIKRFFKRWFNRPRYVCYVDVGNLEADKIDAYIEKVIHNLNTRNTVYIPCRGIEKTEFIKL